MNKENEFNLNLSYNSHEENPFISISNKSKSNSSNNPKSKQFPKKLSNTIENNQNSSSFSINHRKIKKIKNKKEQNSFSINAYSKISNKSLSEKIDEKEKEKEKSGSVTPKKKRDKNVILLETFKNKKKDLLTIDNINGKNLMEYFEKMNENIVFEDKKNNRVSSSGNKLTDSRKEKNTIVPTNKSWNKNNYRFLTNKKPLKIIIKNNSKNEKEKNPSFNLPLKKENRSKSRHHTSNIKNLQNLLNQNNIKLDLKNLIDKYRPNKIFKVGINNINNNTLANDKTNIDKKLSYEKIKITPKSDKHERKFSISHFKIREMYIKNLLKDYNIKKEEKTNINKYINTNEIKPNEKIFEKNKLFHTQLKNKNNDKIFQLNKNNIKISQKKRDTIDNKNINYFLKHKEKLENDKNRKSGI